MSRTLASGLLTFVAVLAVQADETPPVERGPAPRVLDTPARGLPAGWVNKLAWRSVGPAAMGGRITSLAVFDADPTTYWVGTASGGLLKTTNNGISFEHQFDRQATVSVGAVAVAPSDRNVVWVGTGEANPRNSVSFGDGVYKSTDGGKTWKHMGLRGAFQVGDIVIHPKQPDVVYVGALGRLYGPGGDRGLFKTTDGGQTWASILPGLNDRTGVIDIALNPADPDTLLVATWERQRDEFDSYRGDARPKVPGGTDEYGPSTVHAAGSAIYRTTDGGATWARLAKGLPSVHLGRVGLDWSHKDPKRAYAIVDSESVGKGRPALRVYAGFQSDTAKEGGVRVGAVTPNTPAAKAGLKEGDLVTAVGDAKVKTHPEMLEAFRNHKPGNTVKFAVQRGKESLTVELTFAVHPDYRAVLGVRPGDPTPNGVPLADVSELGAAVAAGLQSGDILTAIDGRPVKTADDITKALQDRQAGDAVRVTYTRGAEPRTVEVSLGSASGLRADRPYALVIGGLMMGQRPNVQTEQGPTGVESGGLYATADGGDTWTRVNSFNPRPFYFAKVRVDPADHNTVYVLGIDLHRSTDGGKTLRSTGINAGVHSDQHDLWINPKDSRHLILGTDGGFYVSYDKAARWESQNHAGAIGQFYHVAVDNRTPYRVYGGLQDNGSWGGPSRSDRWPGPINPEWQTVTWGDGFVCRVDPADPDLVYTESQDGNISRTHLKTGQRSAITPQRQPGQQAFRFNWNTPFLLSAHNPAIFYAAGNYVFRSVQRGDNLRAVSPVISRTGRGTATALSESPRNPDVLWAGTDDGAVWLTRDGCKTWTNLSDHFTAAGLPGPRWVSSIEASRWADGRCYVVFDGHRSNDDQPYVFATQDFGQTWKSLRGNLPATPTRVLREDIFNPNLLYLGTEFACFASINRGETWTRLNGEKGLPTVAVHEFAQPTTASDLVVATHGRSVWVLDVAPLRQMTTEVVQGKTALFRPAPFIQWKLTQPPPFYQSTRAFYGQNPPREAALDYVIGKKAAKAAIRIMDVSGQTIRELPASTEPGYHRLAWNLTRTPPRQPGPAGMTRPFRTGTRVAPGEYRVVLTVDGTDYTQTIRVDRDPSLPADAVLAEETEFGEEEESTPERRDN